MNREEILQILQEETDGFTEQSRLRDNVLDALEKVQEKAINYSQCCKSDSEQLTDKIELPKVPENRITNNTSPFARKKKG